MSVVTALPRKQQPHACPDPESLERLLLVCLEELAYLARESGHTRRAERLTEAAILLNSEAIPAHSGALSEREGQVAALVARGLSNRQIAQELVVSDRTVDSHVSNILHKLSLASRAQVAAWVVRRDPGTTQRQHVWRLRTVTGAEAAANLAD